MALGADGTMTIVDAHHHVWSLARGDYAWLTPDRAAIYRDFDLADHAHAAPDVAHSVLVQAAPTVAETRYLLDVARASTGRVLGVVGWVDLDDASASQTLTELARDPLLKSVRPMLQNIPDAQWILRPRVDAALGDLPGLGLRFDALVKPPQLPAMLRMLERHPDLGVIIDHAAKPDIAAGMWEPWASLIRAAAQSPRVYCKLSGLVTEAAPDWSVDTLRPYVDHLFTCFGAGRMAWGSDWPVVNLNGGMTRWQQATRVLLEPLDAAARTAVLGGNAQRFYRLGDAATRDAEPRR
jgi:L-fuconolactonase